MSILLLYKCHIFNNDEYYRVQLIYLEISEENANFIYLQEMGTKIHNHYLKEKMAVNLGYETIFLEKNSMYQKGLCVLYREQRFVLQDNYSFTFQEMFFSENNNVEDTLFASISDNDQDLPESVLYF